MKVEISPRQYSLRIYDDDPTNYIAACQIFRYGDRCFMYSIQGRDFYKGYEEILKWLDTSGFRTLEGYVSEAHARLLRRVLRGSQYKIEILDKGKFDGHDLVWIVVSK